MDIKLSDEDRRVLALCARYSMAVLVREGVYKIERCNIREVDDVADKPVKPKRPTKPRKKRVHHLPVALQRLIHDDISTPPCVLADRYGVALQRVKNIQSRCGNTARRFPRLSVKRTYWSERKIAEWREENEICEDDHGHITS